MQSAYTINISDIEKTVKKAIANGYTVTLEINGEYYDIDTGNQEYEIIKAFDGFSIRKIESNGRYVYLESVYNGKPVWYTDYLYAKKYASREGAKKTIERIKRG